MRETDGWFSVLGCLFSLLKVLEILCLVLLSLRSECGGAICFLSNLVFMWTRFLGISLLLLSGLLLLSLVLIKGRVSPLRLYRPMK